MPVNELSNKANQAISKINSGITEVIDNPLANKLIEVPELNVVLPEIPAIPEIDMNAVMSEATKMVTEELGKAMAKSSKPGKGFMSGTKTKIRKKLMDWKNDVQRIRTKYKEEITTIKALIKEAKYIQSQINITKRIVENARAGVKTLDPSLIGDSITEIKGFMNEGLVDLKESVAEEKLNFDSSVYIEDAKATIAASNIRQSYNPKHKLKDLLAHLRTLLKEPKIDPQSGQNMNEQDRDEVEAINDAISKVQWLLRQNPIDHTLKDSTEFTNLVGGMENFRGQPIFNSAILVAKSIKKDYWDQIEKIVSLEDKFSSIDFNDPNSSSLMLEVVSESKKIALPIDIPPEENEPVDNDPSSIQSFREGVGETLSEVSSSLETTLTNMNSIGKIDTVLGHIPVEPELVSTSLIGDIKTLLPNSDSINSIVSQVEGTVGMIDNYIGLANNISNLAGVDLEVNSLSDLFLSHDLDPAVPGVTENMLNGLKEDINREVKKLTDWLTAQVKSLFKKIEIEAETAQDAIKTKAKLLANSGIPGKLLSGGRLNNIFK